MVHLGVKDDVAKAVYASQGLSHDAFVFLHMLPENWRYNWLSLKFSLLIHYQRWPVSQSLEEAQLITIFESLQGEFWGMLQDPFVYDVDSHIAHDMETPMVDAEENLYVADASCDMYSDDEDSESSFGKFCDDKSVVFHMEDIKCFGRIFTSNYFTSSLFYHERDASNSCDHGEGVCTEDLMVSDTSDIANSEFNRSMHMLPFVGTGCDQQNSLVDKAFAARGEAMLPNEYLLDKHIVESFEAIDVKLADVKELEAVESLDEQVLDDEFEEDDPLTWQVGDPKVCEAVKDASNVFKGFVCLFAGIYVMRYVLEHEVTSTYANDVEGSLEVLECGLAFVGILACPYAHDYVEGIAINAIHVFDMVYEKSFDVKKMPSVLSRLWALACFDMMQSLNVLLDDTLVIDELNNSRQGVEVTKFKQKSTSIILVNEVREVIKILEDLAAPTLNAIFVKKLVTSAMDIKNWEEEITSFLLSFLFLEVMIAQDVAEAFWMLLKVVEDIALDILDAANQLSLFLARVGVDDILAPLDLDEINEHLRPDRLVLK
ncbi:hypothetical protein L7F22_033842 [Adiantum nelumboides]|nr:hypothetical protein [Adiantum nelumboides]